MCLNASESSPYIRDNSIHNTFARCVTIHGTHHVKVRKLQFAHLTYNLLLLPISSGGVLPPFTQHVYLLIPPLCFFIVLNRDLFVIDELEGYHANRLTN